jgi:hypothetical protein
LSQAGELVLEGDVTGREGRDPIGAGFVILEDDVVGALTAEINAAARLFDLLDPYERLGSLWLGAAIVNAGYRHLLKQLPGGRSVPVRMGDERAVTAAEKPRKLTRGSLREPDAEVVRLVALFSRRLGPSGR